MDVARLILEYLQALVWPAVFLMAVVVMRIPIIGLLQRLSSAEFLGFKTSFSNEVAEFQRAVEGVGTRRELEADTTTVVTSSTDAASITQAEGKSTNGAGRSITVKIPKTPSFEKKSPIEVNTALTVYIHYVITQVLSNIRPNVEIMLPAEPESLIQACNRIASITRLTAWGDASNVIVRWEIFWRTLGRRLVAGQLIRRQVQEAAHEAAATIRSIAVFTLNQHLTLTPRHESKEDSKDTQT